MNRAYLAIGSAGLRALRDDGVLPADAYEPFVADDEDEEAEYDAMCNAAEHAQERFGEVVVVAADVDLGAPAGDVPLEAVASFHVGEELSWYAAQELDDLL